MTDFITNVAHYNTQSGDKLKNDEVIIYDNFFSKEDFETFEKEIVNNTYFPWYLNCGKTVHNDHNTKTNSDIIEYLQFTHMLFDRYQKIESTSYYKLFEEKIPYILQKLNLQYINILRAKLNLHDTDGDTIIFDNNFKIKKRINPIKNRVIIFDGITYHTGCNPYKNDKRIVLNINFDL